MHSTLTLLRKWANHTERCACFSASVFSDILLFFLHLTYYRMLSRHNGINNRYNGIHLFAPTLTRQHHWWTFPRKVRRSQRSRIICIGPMVIAELIWTKQEWTVLFTAFSPTHWLADRILPMSIYPTDKTICPTIRSWEKQRRRPYPSKASVIHVLPWFLSRQCWVRLHRRINRTIQISNRITRHISWNPPLATVATRIKKPMVTAITWIDPWKLSPRTWIPTRQANAWCTPVHFARPQHARMETMPTIISKVSLHTSVSMAIRIQFEIPSHRPTAACEVCEELIFSMNRFIVPRL